MPYIHYEFMNIEPLRISDNKSTRDGQMKSLSYIPGSTIRGMVIKRLLEKGESDFEEYKEYLFSERVRFMNAYPVSEDGRRLLPSPKGFYEDKAAIAGKKRIENVVKDGVFTPGYKRASLGQYALIDGDTIRYGSVKKGADLKIKINISSEEKKGMFRNEYIQSGYCFAGDIYVDDNAISERIKDLFRENSTFILGNARTSGLGKCRSIKMTEDETAPFSECYSGEDVSDKCYLLLFSDLVMRDEKTGEYIGIDKNTLAKKLGLQSIDIEQCATSVNKVYGFNRTLGGYIPTVNMYEKGSVFKLEFPGQSISSSVICRIIDEGLGVRKNEGFGVVTIPTDYEKIEYKQTLTIEPYSGSGFEHGEDRETLKTIASNYYRLAFKRAMYRYINKNKLSKGNTSTIGIVESYIAMYLYDYEDGYYYLKKYFSHAMEKENKQNVHKTKSKIEVLYDFIFGILDASRDKFESMLDLPFKEKEDIMGITKDEIISETELGKMKFELLLSMIRFDNKKAQ